MLASDSVSTGDSGANLGLRHGSLLSTGRKLDSACPVLDPYFFFGE